MQLIEMADPVITLNVLTVILLLATSVPTFVMLVLAWLFFLDRDEANQHKPTRITWRKS